MYTSRFMEGTIFFCVHAMHYRVFYYSDFFPCRDRLYRLIPFIFRKPDELLMGPKGKTVAIVTLFFFGILRRRDNEAWSYISSLKRIRKVIVLKGEMKQ